MLSVGSAVERSVHVPAIHDRHGLAAYNVDRSQRFYAYMMIQHSRERELTHVGIP